MKWIKIDKIKEPPITEVLAIGHQDECLIGWLGQTDNDDWICENDSEVLFNIQAFVFIKNVVKDFKDK